MTVIDDAGALSLSNNLSFCGSCSRSRGKNLAASSLDSVFASASAKIIVLVLVRPMRVLGEGEGDSPIDSEEEEGPGELGFRSG